MIKFLVALAILQGLNVLLGSIDAIVDDFKDFDWSTFFKGVAKAIVVFVAAYAVYFIGIKLPDLVVVDGHTNFADASNIVVIAAIGKYFAEVIKKIAKYWGIENKVEDELGLVFDEDIEDEEEITEADIEIKEEETEAGAAKLENAEGEKNAI
jgi:hypothetical protein